MAKRSKKVTSYDRAISILRGSGIKVDEKGRTQTWQFGRIYTDKQANAGNFLGKYNLENNGEFTTVWLDSEGELPIPFGKGK